MRSTFFLAFATPFIGSKMSVISDAGSGCPFSKRSALIFGYHSSTSALLFSAKAAHSGAFEVSTVTLNPGSAKAQLARHNETIAILISGNAKVIRGWYICWRHEYRRGAFRCYD